MLSIVNANRQTHPSQWSLSGADKRGTVGRRRHPTECVALPRLASRQPVSQRRLHRHAIASGGSAVETLVGCWQRPHQSATHPALSFSSPHH